MRQAPSGYMFYIVPETDLIFGCIGEAQIEWSPQLANGERWLAVAGDISNYEINTEDNDS